MADPMIRSALVAALNARRDNDVTVEVDGLRVPVVGVTYCPTGDQIVLQLDPEYLPGPAPTEPDPYDHVLTVDSPMSLGLDHPTGCQPHTCPVAEEVGIAQRADKLPPPGRYEVGINDLGDRLLIGDRIEAP